MTVGIPFEKGKSGNPKGRPKGSTNKIVFDFAKTCKEQGYDPCLELIHLARTANSWHARVAAASEIASYVAPKLKAVEFTQTSDEQFSIVLNVSKPPETKNGS